MADLGLQGKRQPARRNGGGVGGNDGLSSQRPPARLSGSQRMEQVDAAQQGSAQRQEKGRGPGRGELWIEESPDYSAPRAQACGAGGKPFDMRHSGATQRCL